MALFKIAEDSYIDGLFRPRGSIIVVEPSAHNIPGPHWEPLDDEARAMCEAAGVNYAGAVPGLYATIEQNLRRALKTNGAVVESYLSLPEKGPYAEIERELLAAFKADGGRFARAAPIIANAVAQALGPACEVLYVPAEKRATLAGAVAAAIIQALA